MNNWTLKFNSRVLEKMYQAQRKEKIFEFFKIAFKIILVVCLIAEVFYFLNDYIYLWEVQGPFISLVLIYIYVTCFNKGSAKYFLGYLAISLSFFQYLRGDERVSFQEAFLSGQFFTYLQMSLISQSGFWFNTIIMIILMAIRIAIAKVSGFLIMQVLLPFSMLFYNYYIYLTEKLNRQLFLQTLKEGSWDKILSWLTDKHILILTFDEILFAFQVKYQNILKLDQQSDFQREIREIMRQVQITKFQNLEAWLFEKFKYIQANQVSIGYEGLEEVILLKEKNLSLPYNWKSISIHTINLKELNFIIVFESKTLPSNAQTIQITNVDRLRSILTRNSALLRDQFNCLNEIYKYNQSNLALKSKQLNEKTFELRLLFIQNILKNAKFLIQLQFRDEQSLNLTKFNLYELIKEGKKYFQRKGSLQFEIIKKRQCSLVYLINDIRFLQMIFFTIFNKCQFKALCNQNKTTTLVKIEIRVFSNLNVCEVQFQLPILGHSTIKLSKLVNKIYRVLGPYKEIKVDQIGYECKLLKYIFRIYKTKLLL